MHLRVLLPSLLVCLAASAAETHEFFEKRIRPVLAKQCYACHSAQSKLGGLDLTSRASLLQGGNSGAAIVPGKASESLLIRSIEHASEKLKMPTGQAKLSATEIADLRTWVDAGAAWPAPTAATSAAPGSKGRYEITPEQRAFWAFQPVTKPALPAVKNSAWAQTPIDRFIAAKLDAAGLAPNHAADRRTLIRRATFDLTGLPATAAEVDAFVNDSGPQAWAKVVDRLLKSPRYGERWARFWLDVARYSDDRLESEVEAPYANAFRYRDWVVNAFNEDMPYDRFVKAQIAGDLLQDKDRTLAGLGFYALSPDTQEDRVDATGRAFLGLTTGCAQCHNHKFDPIPQRDYYALLGVFTSTERHETPLAPAAEVKAWRDHAKRIADKKAEIRDFLHGEATQLSILLAGQTARYTRAAARVMAGGATDADNTLDRETLDRWIAYLRSPEKDHDYLKAWGTPAFDHDEWQRIVVGVLKERKEVDDTNLVRRAQAKETKTPPELVALKPQSFYVWRDMFFSDFYGNQFKQEDDGLLYYGPNRGFLETDGTVERFLDGIWKTHLAQLRAELKQWKETLPPQYPFLHTIKDREKPNMERLDGKGEEVPRGFLSILSPTGAPLEFKRGSGRLELAEAIASPANPLTARVMVNRIWQHHFETGLVRTASDFGRMGERPSHPELLDYLASRLVENQWSVKALHREIMLSAVYQVASVNSAEPAKVDPDNRLLWRANTRRLDAEALRDSMLAVTGELNLAMGGQPFDVSEDKDRRRAIHGFVSRRKLNAMLALFDVPNPNASSDRRAITITPPQQLFFLNGGFVARRGDALAAQVKPGEIGEIYRRVFAREPLDAEVRLGREYLAASPDGRWAAYAQALLNSNEFLFVN
ncbi:MAG: DUF1553 domain-containing protein [Acidobacteria bacterium]|nr:DUF1553 domain-containing protein [Acidobacteriota bacterium]